MTDKGEMEEGASMDLLIRNYHLKDRSFIISSWVQSYKLMSSFAKKISYDVYLKWHPKIIEGILAKPMIQIQVACSGEDPESISGYIVSSAVRSPDEDRQEIVVQYLFVKKEFQRLGIARRLFKTLNAQEGDLIYFTHLTDAMTWSYPRDGRDRIPGIMQKHPELIYNPYLI